MSEDNTQKIKITFSNIHILDEIHCHDTDDKSCICVTLRKFERDIYVSGYTRINANLQAYTRVNRSGKCN